MFLTKNHSSKGSTVRYRTAQRIRLMFLQDLAELCSQDGTFDLKEVKELVLSYYPNKNHFSYARSVSNFTRSNYLQSLGNGKYYVTNKTLQAIGWM
jgi:hypothetical protein